MTTSTRTVYPHPAPPTSCSKLDLFVSTPHTELFYPRPATTPWGTPLCRKKKDC